MLLHHENKVPTAWKIEENTQSCSGNIESKFKRVPLTARRIYFNHICSVEGEVALHRHRYHQQSVHANVKHQIYMTGSPQHRSWSINLFTALRWRSKVANIKIVIGTSEKITLWNASASYISLAASPQQNAIKPSNPGN